MGAVLRQPRNVVLLLLCVTKEWKGILIAVLSTLRTIRFSHLLRTTRLDSDRKETNIQTAIPQGGGS